MTILSALRPASALVALALTAGATSTALAGCGGTNSETPWPIEPDDVDLGPEGESRGNEQLGAPAPAAPTGGKTAPTAKPAAAPAEEAPQNAPRAPEPAAPSNPSTQF